MAHDVFISHSVKDKVTADAVCAMLESNGIRCWIAPRDVLPGMEWGECIIDAIEECRIMVLVFTADANASPQIRREVERAVNRGVTIVPLRIEDVLPGKALQYFIGNVHWLDALTPPLEAHLKNLAGTIKIVLARTEPGAPPMLRQGERPPASSGHGAARATPQGAGGRETAPAPRHFWGTRAWTWAAGSAAALLLVAVFVGVHFTSHPASATSPEPVMQPAPGAPGPAGPGGATPVTPTVLPSPTTKQGDYKAPRSAAKAPEAIAANINAFTVPAAWAGAWKLKRSMEYADEPETDDPDKDGPQTKHSSWACKLTIDSSQAASQPNGEYDFDDSMEVTFYDHISKRILHLSQYERECHVESQLFLAPGKQANEVTFTTVVTSQSGHCAYRVDDRQSGTLTLLPNGTLRVTGSDFNFETCGDEYTK